MQPHFKLAIVKAKLVRSDWNKLQHYLNMQDNQGENGPMGMASMMREVQELADKFKVEEDEQYISPYAHLEKATVLQEAR